ncbi:MAG: hypothetical protein MUC40_07110 [Akkermansiaceae bacterium]|nr:hypothetical protein [Akkermansiaceae bacterium]
MERRKLIRREAVGRVTGFRLDDVQQTQLRAEGFGLSGRHFQHALGGIGEINCDNDGFHGTSNKTRADADCKPSLCKPSTGVPRHPA